MTGPLGGDSLGDAYINVHANTSDFEPDLEKGLKKAGKDTEDDADDVGSNLGDHIGRGVEKEVGKHGPAIGRAIGNAIEKEEIPVKPNLRYNVRGKDGRFVSQAAANISSEVEDAFSRAVGDGGIFTKFGQAISDAIGAGFNIPGRSPLIVGLIPVIGAVVGLVGGLLQIINAVAATLTTIPALIGAIGLQAGVLILAFKGVGSAISGAFAAKNYKELQEALVDLTPAAKAFVVSLLPLKDLYDALKQVSQQSFFLALGNSVMDVVNNVAPLLRRNITELSAAMGQSIAQILHAFSGPDFHNFIANIIPATEKWLHDFGPAFATFLIGLIKLGDSAIPLLSKLGDLLNSGLIKLGTELSKISDSKTFQKWLSQMFDTLKLLGPLIAAAFGFIVAFLDQLNKAGADSLITSLTNILVVLTNFIASEVGLRSINELIGLAIASFYVLASVVMVVLFLLASIQAFVDWFSNTAIPAAVDAIVRFGLFLEGVVKAIGGWFADVAKGIKDWVVGALNTIANFFVGFLVGVKSMGTNMVAYIKGVPGMIMNALGDLGNLLLNAGRNVINGFLRGIQDRLGALRALLMSVTNLLPSWKGPEDKDRKILRPAGEAVMEGFGEGLSIGARDIAAMLGDFTNGLGGIGMNSTENHIAFGAGAVAVNFRGALPTTDQAMAAGQAVGAGINSQLAARNTRLAVRTL